mmetsp:Transcript_104979/g.208707  ORF Transcript_104979/g.208707 Transcript_104979/m.208707 type:complete len:218 (-) Transcript_104979:363-1016(-)
MKTRFVRSSIALARARSDANIACREAISASRCRLAARSASSCAAVPSSSSRVSSSHSREASNASVSSSAIRDMPSNNCSSSGPATMGGSCGCCASSPLASRVSETDVTAAVAPERRKSSTRSSITSCNLFSFSTNRFRSWVTWQDIREPSMSFKLSCAFNCCTCCRVRMSAFAADASLHSCASICSCRVISRSFHFSSTLRIRDAVFTSEGTGDLSA